MQQGRQGWRAPSPFRRVHWSAARLRHWQAPGSYQHALHATQGGSAIVSAVPPRVIVPMALQLLLAKCMQRARAAVSDEPLARKMIATIKHESRGNSRSG